MLLVPGLCPWLAMEEITELPYSPYSWEGHNQQFASRPSLPSSLSSSLFFLPFALKSTR